MKSQQVSTHERLADDGVVGGSSDRSFGFVFAALFGIIGLWPLLDDGGVRWWSLAIALVFAELQQQPDRGFEVPHHVQ